MKTKNLIVVLVALLMASAMAPLAFYGIERVEEGFGLVYVTKDGKCKSCKEFEGISIYPRNADVYKYRNTVQKVRFGMRVIAKDSYPETIYVDLDYQIENAVDFIQCIIKDANHYKWSPAIHLTKEEVERTFGYSFQVVSDSLRNHNLVSYVHHFQWSPVIHFIPGTKEEVERTFEYSLLVVSDSLARDYDLMSLATPKFENELKEGFEEINNIKGIKVTSLRVSTEFNKLLKSALEDVNKAEEALIRAEIERAKEALIRAEIERAKAEQDRGKLVHLL